MYFLELFRVQLTKGLPDVSLHERVDNGISLFVCVENCVSLVVGSCNTKVSIFIFAIRDRTLDDSPNTVISVSNLIDQVELILLNLSL